MLMDFYSSGGAIMQKVVRAKSSAKCVVHGPVSKHPKLVCFGLLLAAKKWSSLAKTGPERGTVLIAKGGLIMPMVFPLGPYR